MLQPNQLLSRFLRDMPVRDVAYLLLKPFMGQKKGATKAEVVSRLVEHADMKDAAAQLTQVADECSTMCLKPRASNDCGFSKRQKVPANFRWSTTDKAYAIIPIPLPKDFRFPSLPI